MFAQPNMIPLAFIQRECIMTQDQVEGYLGQIVTADNVKIPVQVVLIILGFLLFLLAVCLICKYKKLRKREELGIGSMQDYKELP